MRGRVPLVEKRREFDQEIRHHIDEKADFLVSQGWEKDEAYRIAVSRFGDADRIRREMMKVKRDRDSTWFWLLASDVHYALRGMKANPGFVAAVVATLTLGIGAATAIFVVVDALLLRPMPYEDSDRWVEMNQLRSDGGYNEGLPTPYAIWSMEATEELFDGRVSFVSEIILRTDRNSVEALNVVVVTPGAERLLGIPLAFGRGFTQEDARPGTPPVAILSQEYWKSTGADSDIIGETLTLESGLVTVVGVLASGVKFPDMGLRSDLWIPLRDDFTYADHDQIGRVQGLWARLYSDIDLATAQQRIGTLLPDLLEDEPTNRSWSVGLLPIGAHRANPNVRSALWTLSATVTLLFLIALVNGVNLLLVRASARRQEIAVRVAIGASRLRILQQVLIEGIVLGLFGGLAALTFAWGAVFLVREILPSDVLFFSPYAIAIEGRALFFIFATSLAVGTILGLLPAIHTLTSRQKVLSQAARQRDGSPIGRRVRGSLVVVQVSLSTTLLVAAGLLVNSFARLLAVDPGYDSERIAFAVPGLSSTRYADFASRTEMLGRLEVNLEAHPAIDAVTVSSGGRFNRRISLEAEGETIPENQPSLIPHIEVAEDFFETMGVEIVTGRGFNSSDIGTENVMVDLDLARFLWGDQSPVGRRFRIRENSTWWTVVGVFGELALMGRDERRGPYQFLSPIDPVQPPRFVQVAMRTSGSAEALLPIFQETIRSIDPEVWTQRLRTASDALAEDEENLRFVVTLMSVLATVAMVLAAVGLYGVLAYSVGRRSRELGIRMAVGADGQSLRRMVLAEGLGVTMLGVLLGLFGAWFATRVIDQLLYDVQPGDPATFLAATVMFLVVATIACLLPATRATRVDPVAVLRAE